MEPSYVTRTDLARDLRAVGLRAGQVAMVHAAMSRMGHIVGGAQTLVEALIDVLGENGTLLVLTGWEDRPPYHQDEWDDEARRTYERECPVFDPRVARA